MSNRDKARQRSNARQKDNERFRNRLEKYRQEHGKPRPQSNDPRERLEKVSFSHVKTKTEHRLDRELAVDVRNRVDDYRDALADRSNHDSHELDTDAIDDSEFRASSVVQSGWSSRADTSQFLLSPDSMSGLEGEQLSGSPCQPLPLNQELVKLLAGPQAAAQSSLAVPGLLKSWAWPPTLQLGPERDTLSITRNFVEDANLVYELKKQLAEQHVELEIESNRRQHLVEERAEHLTESLAAVRSAREERHEALSTRGAIMQSEASCGEAWSAAKPELRAKACKRLIEKANEETARAKLKEQEIEKEKQLQEIDGVLEEEGVGILEDRLTPELSEGEGVGEETDSPFVFKDAEEANDVQESISEPEDGKDMEKVYDPLAACGIVVFKSEDNLDPLLESESICKTWVVQADCQSSARLGIGLDSDEVDSCIIKITDVNEIGLIAQWNENHPDESVHTLDQIVSVNGVRDSLDDMASELRKKEVLHLEVARKEQGYFTIELDRTEGLLVGMAVNLNPGSLEIREVFDEGLLADWNEYERSVRVQRGDFILEVNGVKEDGLKLVHSFEECCVHRVLCMRRALRYGGTKWQPQHLDAFRQKPVASVRRRKENKPVGVNSTWRQGHLDAFRQAPKVSRRRTRREKTSQGGEIEEKESSASEVLEAFDTEVARLAPASTWQDVFEEFEEYFDGTWAKEGTEKTYDVQGANGIVVFDDNKKNNSYTFHVVNATRCVMVINDNEHKGDLLDAETIQWADGSTWVKTAFSGVWINEDKGGIFCVQPGDNKVRFDDGSEFEFDVQSSKNCLMIINGKEHQGEFADSFTLSWSTGSTWKKTAFGGRWMKEGTQSSFFVQSERRKVAFTTPGKNVVAYEFQVLSQTECRMVINGKEHQGELLKDGRIKWSTDSTWIRLDGPIALAKGDTAD